MKFKNRLALLAAASLLVASQAVGQGAVSGFVTDGCTAGWDNGAAAAELYIIKVAGSGNGTDLVYDLTNKRGGTPTRTGGFQVNNDGSFAGNQNNFQNTETSSDTYFAFLTMSNGNIAIDAERSSLLDGSLNWGLVSVQTVGDNNSLTIPGDGPISVDLGGGAAEFPKVTTSGIEVVFGALQDHTVTPDMNGCSPGGNAVVPASLGLGGGIVGYNIYRQASATAPAADSWDETNWLYYVPMTDFDRDVAQPAGGAAGMGSPAETVDSNADYAGFQNLNGGGGGNTGSDGDEFVVFADTAAASRLAGGLPPATLDGTVYWYVMQPCAPGNHADWAGNTISLANNEVTVDTPAGGFTIDLDEGGSGDPEFFSPQALAGLPGLGLTHNSLPLVSQPVQMSAEPAAARFGFELRRANADTLELTSSLEGANVAGYNVFAVSGDSQTKLNDRLIVANGGEGSVYRIANERSGRRVKSRTGSSYMVEVVFDDGTPSRMEGPYTVAAPSRETRQDRRRR